MIRAALVLGALTLAACAPTVPDSGRGVGFEDYSDYNNYRVQRESELNRTRGPSSTVTVRPPSSPPAKPDAGNGGYVNASPNNPTVEILPATPVANAPTPLNNGGISDEQDFSAVSNRQSIESDAARLRAQREAFEVIAPTEVPTRSGNTGPNIVQFALSTTNEPGQKIHRRNALTTQARYERNCAKYASPDLAQEAFLSSGGPERDKLGIDPDGDGFACGWDPRPYRRIRS
ncbi:MAG: hypothetical protein LJE68_09560 [Rhodobacter sp.]|nr:hypothetical protein [Rhodobacter sp.]